MKIFLILVFLFFSNSVFADVYYCVEDKIVGIKNPDYNEIVRFPERRFKLKIDLENLEVESLDILFVSRLNGSCKINNNKNNRLLICDNGGGLNFTINLESKEFVHSSGFGYLLNQNDDVYFSIGKCELF
ncbi:hypothetical protein OAQ96_02515 [Alphaproteobacteria bacterium]|nr:hypothetical protein [Alphaproteobacteria bacterium]